MRKLIRFGVPILLIASLLCGAHLAALGQQGPSTLHFMRLVALGQMGYNYIEFTNSVCIAGSASCGQCLNGGRDVPTATCASGEMCGVFGGQTGGMPMYTNCEYSNATPSQYCSINGSSTIATTCSLLPYWDCGCMVIGSPGSSCANANGCNCVMGGGGSNGNINFNIMVTMCTTSY